MSNRSPSPLSSTTILIVDDDPRLSDSLSRSIAQAGGQSRIFSDGAGVLPWLSTQPGDLVLLELQLPGIDGVELCLQINRLPHPPPILIITAEPSVERQLAALSAGAADLVLKPFHPRVLLRRAANLLQRRQAQAANKKLIARLESYISPAAARSLGTQERIEATLLFSDLRGFTAASFTQDADRVFTLVNAVLTGQTRIIQNAGGYVDGFSGDGLLALFEGDDAETRACDAAAQILRWAASTELGDWKQLPVGMGVHHGTVIRGDLGDARRRVFTVLGSPVNIAARMCGVASALEAVVSTGIVRSVNAPERFHTPRPVSLRGLPAPLTVYSLHPAPR